MKRYEPSYADAVRCRKAFFAAREKNSRVSYRDVADYLGMSVSAVHQYLHGTIGLNVEFILRLAFYLEIEPWQLSPQIPVFILRKES